MISTKPGSPAFAILAALVKAEGATASELAADILALPALTLADTTGPDRLRLLAEREAARRAHETQVGRLLGRLQEAGLVETRSPVRVSESWRQLVARRGEVEALRCLSCWAVREDLVSPYLALIAKVESQPGCVGSLSGQDGQRYRHLVAWDVLVAPSQRWVSEKGRALIEGAP